MMKNAFYFILKAIFHEIFKLLSSLFHYVKNRPDQKEKVNLKMYNTDITDTDKMYNTDIAQYLTK